MSFGMGNVGTFGGGKAPDWSFFIPKVLGEKVGLVPTTVLKAMVKNKVENKKGRGRASPLYLEFKNTGRISSPSA